MTATPATKAVDRSRVTRQLRFESLAPIPTNSVSTNTSRTNGQSDRDTKSGTTTTRSTGNNSIQVFLRIRPFNDDEKKRSAESCLLSAEGGKLQIRPKVAVKHPPRIRAANKAVFRFSHIFDESHCQADIFERTSLSLIDDLFNGQDAVIFAYGVTCSGKTYTIQGNPQFPGILPRALDVIINSISMAKGHGLAQDTSVSDSVAELTNEVHHRRRWRQRTVDTAKNPVHDANYLTVDPSVDYEIFASYLEVYNDQVYDLFDKSTVIYTQEDVISESSEATDGYDVMDEHHLRPRRRALRLKERPSPHTPSIPDVYGEGQTEVRIQSVADIDRLVEFGCNNRSVAHTSSNATSSRSHAIFVIILRQTKETVDPSGKKVTTVQESKLNIVDLAGSEKSSKADSCSTRVVESRKINTSLMTLSRCFEVMRYNQQITGNSKYVMCQPRIVPFRDSKLTRLLHRSLSIGAAVMIATMSPTVEDADETIHALCSTAIAREVKLKPSTSRYLLRDVTNTVEGKDGAGGKPPKRIQVPNTKTLSAHKRIGNRRALRARTDIENNSTEGVLARDLEDLKRNCGLLQDQLDVSLDELKQKTDRLERVEEALRISESARVECEEQSDKLFRENERLRDRLAHVEAKLQVLQVEIAENTRSQVNQIVSDMREMYEKEVSRLRSQRDDAIVKVSRWDNNHVAKERMIRKIARTSCAALETMRLDMQAMNDEDAAQQLMSDGEMSEDSIEYVE